MSKSKSVTVGPKTVRAWARENEKVVRALKVTRTVKGEQVTEPANLASLFGGPQGRGRGRLAQNGPIVQAFLEANPGTVYAEHVESVKTIDLPLVSAKTGRPIKPVTVPMTEFRRLSGTTKGKPSAEALSRAAAAYQAEQGK